MTWELRRLTRTDFGLLAQWLSDPAVHRWWFHDVGVAELERDFGPGVDDLEPGEDLVVLRDGRPFGLVQRARVTDYPEDLEVFERILGPVDHDAATLDYLVGSADDRGRGLGPVMLDAVTRLTFAARPDAPYVLVAVVAANRRSWRALEKAGFRVVGSGDAEPDNPVDPPLHHVLRRDRERGE